VGDILNPQNVDDATAQDAVIYSLGTGVTFKPVTLFSDGTRHLLDAMTAHRASGCRHSVARAAQ